MARNVEYKNKKLEELQRKPYIQDLISDSDKLFIDSVNNKRRFSRTWFINLAYLLGHQWLGFGLNGEIYDLLQQEYARDGRVRMVENQIIVSAFKMVARILRSEPILDVIPNSNSLKDIESSKCGEKILTYLWEKLCFLDETLPKLILDTVIYGTSFLKVYWDKEAGDDLYLPKVEKIEIPKTILDEDGFEIQVKDQSGKPVMNTKYVEQIDELGEKMYEQIRTGEVSVDVISPFDMHFNIEAQRFDDALKIIQQKDRNLEYVEDKYKVLLSKESSGSQNYSRYENKIKRLLWSDAEYTVPERNSIIVKEYYEKPSRKYPKGRFSIMAGGKVLEYAEEYPYGEVPYVPFYFFQLNNRLWGESLISHMVPLQKQLNMVSSKLISNTKLMSNPKWLVPKGSGIKQSSFTEREGEIINYNADLTGSKPQQIQGVPIPSYVENLYGKLKQGIMDISSQHEVSAGRVPPGVESSTAIMALQESDDLILSPIIKSIERSYGHVGSMMLRRVKQFYEESRKIKIVGENNVLDEIYMFNKSDLQDSYDVKVRSASGLPLTKSGRIQTVFDLVQRGILDPQSQQKMIMHMIDLPEINMELGIHTKQAMLENIMLKEGRPAPVTEWQDQDAHLKILEDFMNTQEYSRLSNTIKDLFINHRLEHEDMRLGLQAKMLADQQKVQILAQQMVQPQGGQAMPSPGAAGMPPNMQGELPIQNNVPLSSNMGNSPQEGEYPPPGLM